MGKQKLTGSQERVQGPPRFLPEGASSDVEPQLLLLDPQNVRLLELADRELEQTPARLIGQPSIQDRVYDVITGEPSFEIDDLVNSIIKNGFLKHERLIVARYDARHYLVLEGNRRTTAVKKILRDFATDRVKIDSEIWRSIETLPCFLLDGPAILDGDPATKKSPDDVLQGYREAAEVYVGLRHLMGAKSWEPASRYEFQQRLIERGWTIQDVAERFGRKITEVLRDLKAQRLYRDFRSYEKSKKRPHALTYNVFAQAARTPVIMKWLGWDDKKMAITKRRHEDALFSYIISRLSRRPAEAPEGEEISRQESAEGVIKTVREMLKLKDPDIEEALADSDFDTADLLYENRKEGKLSARLSSFIRQLRAVSLSELRQSPAEHSRLLKELIEQAQEMREVVLARRPG